MSERMAPPPPEFATFVEEHLGLYDETPICLDWDSILRQRLGATRSSNFDSYRNRLTTAPALREEVAQLAQLMTVGRKPTSFATVVNSKRSRQSCYPSSFTVAPKTHEFRSSPSLVPPAKNPIPWAIAALRITR